MFLHSNLLMFFFFSRHKYTFMRNCFPCIRYYHVIKYWTDLYKLCLQGSLLILQGKLFYEKEILHLAMTVRYLL